ncbi:MAG: tetratricopeptide repeat protein [Chitinophagaceae bacterium]|nr:tetratricopeptide repeat protein [Chitinophagaceae bacterium]
MLLVCLFFSYASFSQKDKADSLRFLLTNEKADTNRVNLLRQLATAIGVYNPDTALILSYQSLSLARNIGYVEGESRAIGVLANTFRKFGNFSKALELNIQKLKLEEKRNNQRNMASVLNNIGTVYVLQEEYRKALEYYSKADSIIRKYNVEELKYYITLNIGDVYNRLDISDSAFTYFSKSLELAKNENDGDLIGTSMTGLGHSFLKLGSYKNSLTNYQTAIGYLQAAGDDEILCEATLGLANLYEHMGEYDSATHYAGMSLAIAKKDGFLSLELDAAEFLTDHYKKIKNIDSAFTYVSYVKGLNDSVNSKSKIRESQVIYSNEQFRQLELEEERRIAKKERVQQLQMLLIAIFIPGFFLLTLLLSRVIVHVKMIRLLGVLSLLFLFEYLTLLLHPTVARLTHHTPVYEILIFVGIAAILIPLHHKLEHWLIHKLIHHRHGTPVKNKTPVKK